MRVLLHYKQPVEGLENLSDDQQLWDLFNGNTEAAHERPRLLPRRRRIRPAAKSKSATAQKKSGKKATAQKDRSLKRSRHQNNSLLKKATGQNASGKKNQPLKNGAKTTARMLSPSKASANKVRANNATPQGWRIEIK